MQREMERKVGMVEQSLISCNIADRLSVLMALPSCVPRQPYVLATDSGLHLRVDSIFDTAPGAAVPETTAVIGVLQAADRAYKTRRCPAHPEIALDFKLTRILEHRGYRAGMEWEWSW